MRAFIGISLPDGVRTRLASLQQQLDASRADVKWVEPSNLHVTLKFLDEITQEQRLTVEALLGRVAGHERAFILELGHADAFPSTDAPRVLWVGLAQGKETVVRLAQAIERDGPAIPLRRARPGAGPSRAGEERPFAAHVTLGRVRTPRNRAALSQRLQESVWSPPEAWHVSSLTLYESVLSSAGPHYNMLADIPLQAQ
ncbi:MAG: RNA 2',3'-cyclic phosphodiesterase [Candidatus Omnitrophota bacterium]|nr:RNA 2',3'-cyclic phosphodiesterase [Candidatus Omnitrophota bacterium]